MQILSENNTDNTLITKISKKSVQIMMKQKKKKNNQNEYVKM